MSLNEKTKSSYFLLLVILNNIDTTAHAQLLVAVVEVAISSIVYLERNQTLCSSGMLHGVGW
jgi:hypothetical protein